MVSLYKNLDRMQAFSVSEEATLDLETTGINEFEKLNEVVAGLADRVREEYQTVRQFTSYAAHELRTPLAVMRSGLRKWSSMLNTTRCCLPDWKN